MQQIIHTVWSQESSRRINVRDTLSRPSTEIKIRPVEQNDYKKQDRVSIWITPTAKGSFRPSYNTYIFLVRTHALYYTCASRRVTRACAVRLKLLFSFFHTNKIMPTGLIIHSFKFKSSSTPNVAKSKTLLRSPV
jgi:hypothetical protein